MRLGVSICVCVSDRFNPFKDMSNNNNNNHHLFCREPIIFGLSRSPGRHDASEVESHSFLSPMTWSFLSPISWSLKEQGF